MLSALRTPPAPSVLARIAEGALMGAGDCNLQRPIANTSTNAHARMQTYTLEGRCRSAVSTSHSSSSQRIRENSSSPNPQPGGALGIDGTC